MFIPHLSSLSLSLKKIYLFILIYVHTNIYINLYMSCVFRGQRDFRIEVKGSYESHDVGAGGIT